MSQFEYGKHVNTLLAEYVDGGPGCVRDDCQLAETFSRSLLTSDPGVLEEKTKRCISCGKTWMEKYQNGARIS